MKLKIDSDRPLVDVAFRLGPFKNIPGNEGIIVNGKVPKTTLTKRGDSWWESFTMTVEPSK